MKFTEQSAVAAPIVAPTLAQAPEVPKSEIASVHMNVDTPQVEVLAAP